jgi:hypothetical protein
MALLTETYATLYNRAISEPLGLIVDVTNPDRFQINLATWVRNQPDRRFDEIMVCLPSTPDTVFLVKKSVELE